MSIDHSNSIKKSLIHALNQLNSVSSSPVLDAEILLACALKKPKEYFYTHPEKCLTKSQIKKFRRLIFRRAKHEPIAYIIGHKEFYGLKFKVNKNTLIPRPDTELMVEEVLHIISFQNHWSLLVDIGAGTGCIPIAIIKNAPKNKKTCAYATDISPNALKIARKNAVANKVAEKIKFLKGNLLEPAFYAMEKAIKNNHNLNIILTANLPYLPEAIYKDTPPDIKSYEPKYALYGGKDGLKYYKILFKQLNNFFKKEKQRENFSLSLLCEIDPSQKNSIKHLIKCSFPNAKIEIKKDLSGLNRLCIAKFNPG